MSIQLNLGEHISKVPWFITIPPGCRPDAQWARSRAKAIAGRIASANVYFRSLPNGRSLSSLLSDRSIWINYSLEIPVMGASAASETFKEIAISNWAFRNGRWTVLATLIHELAHINGAPEKPSQAAEDALVHCGLGTLAELRTRIDNPNTPYDPKLRG